MRLPERNAMTRRIRAAVVGVTLLHGGRLAAQSIPKDFVTDIKSGVSDVLVVWAAPFRGGARDYAIGAASLGVAGAFGLADERVATWVRTHPTAGVMRALRPLRHGQGDVYVKAAGGSGHTPGAFAVYTVGLLTRSQAIRDLGMGCLAAAEAHMTFRQIVYASVSRERPLYRDTVDGVPIERAGRPYHVRFPGTSSPDDNSFFSGHAASVFSCVTFVNTRFHLRYAEPVLWAFAGALSVGRAADQRHYVSDVLIGSLIGFGAGRLVGHRSQARMEKRAKNKAITAPDSSREASRSWRDGMYLSRHGSSIVVGWSVLR